MRKKGWKQWLLLLVCGILVLAGCTSQSTSTTQTDTDGTTDTKTDKEKILYAEMPGEAEKLDPHWATSVNELFITTTIFNGLVRFPPGTVDIENIEGDLAESWEHNEDSTVWTFYLRKGVQWQKGYGELTSADVKWSFERVMDPNTGSPWGKDYENIESIETPDDYTVVFKLKRPDVSFLLKVLNYHGGNIVKKEAIEDAGDNFMISPVGTGPFMLEEYRTKEKVVLVKNPDYFRGEPKLDKIVYYIMTDPTAVEVAQDRGEIHLARGVADKMWQENRKKNPDLIFEFPDYPLFWGLYLNTSKPPLDDIRVRQAIAHAIDVESYVENVLGTDIAKVPQGVIASNYFGSVPVGHYEYNPEKAKQLLAEAGYPNGLTLPVQYVSTNKSYLNRMIYVQEQLRKVGIEMPMEQVDHATYHANTRKDLNAIVLYAYVRTPHADVPLTEFFYGPSTVGTDTGITNFSHYNAVDRLIEEARVAPDVETAMQLYEEIQRKIKEDYVVVPMDETYNVLIRRKEVNMGYVSDRIQGTMIYGYPINENTDIIQ